MTKRPFFPPSSRALLGVAIIAASTILTYGKAQSVQGQIQPLLWITANRSPGDSAVFASAAYHAGHAALDYNRRWGPAGYLTLGSAGVIFGLALALSTLRRERPRPTEGQ